MQLVCVSAAKNILVEKFVDEKGGTKTVWFKQPDTSE